MTFASDRKQLRHDVVQRLAGLIDAELCPREPTKVIYGNIITFSIGGVTYNVTVTVARNQP